MKLVQHYSIIIMFNSVGPVDLHWIAISVKLITWRHLMPKGKSAKFTWFLATIPFAINEPICVTKPFPVNSYVGRTKVFILVLTRSFTKLTGKFASISARIGYKPILIAKSVAIYSYIVRTESLIFIFTLDVSISWFYCKKIKKVVS